MKELLNRYFAETLTDLEKAELFERLDEDKALKDEFVRLQNTMAVSGMLPMNDDDGWASAKYKEMIKQAGKNKTRRLSLSLLKYASVAVLLIAVWFLSKEYTQYKDINDDYTCIEAPKGQRVYVTLADGTEAWLSSRSQLKIPNQFNKKNREVELDGEGFFSVSKNTGKPFVVKTNQYNIQVTGTQFNVFAYKESSMFETDLVEGSVLVFEQDNESNRMTLKPNEKAYLEAGQLHKLNYSFIQSQHIKNGIYSFEDKSLQELCKRLELWYDVKICIEKQEIADYIFSGKFRQTDDIDNILRAVKETGKFNYRIVDEKKIEIY